jgi:plasmid replication initiation protein
MSKTKRLPERTDAPLPERYISMSNAVARSSQGLGLVEKRIIALGLAKTDSVPTADLVKASREGWKVRFNAAEYAESYDLDMNTAYEQMKEAGDQFLKKTIRRLEKDHKGRIIEHKYNWLTGTTYHHGEGWVEIRFSFEVAPHLLGLRSKFTSYKLKQASALRSVYAWRLFECLQSWKDKGRWVVDVDEFNAIMEVPESFKKNFGMMRRRVLEPSLKELREKDSMDINLDLVKAGRKVTGLCFTFSPCAQQRLDLGE